MFSFFLWLPWHNWHNFQHLLWKSLYFWYGNFFENSLFDKCTIFFFYSHFMHSHSTQGSKNRTNRFTNSQISFFDELLESWNFQSNFFTRIMLTKTKKLFTHTRYYYSDYITLRLSLLVPGSVWTYMYEQCVSWIVSYFFLVSFRKIKRNTVLPFDVDLTVLPHFELEF